MHIDEATGIDAIYGLAGGEKDLSSFSWMISLEALLKDSISLYVNKRFEEQVKNGKRLSRGMLEKVPEELNTAVREKGFLSHLAAVRTAGGKLLAIHRILSEYDKIDSLNINEVFTKSVVIF
jgi:hypothetical protein